MFSSDWLPLTDVKTPDDVRTHNEKYNTFFTAEEFVATFPKLDPSKVYFDGHPEHTPLYFDKETMAVRETHLFRSMDSGRLILPTQIPYISDPQNAMLIKMNFIARLRQDDEWRRYVDEIMPYYRVDVLDAIAQTASEPGLAKRLESIRVTYAVNQ